MISKKGIDKKDAIIIILLIMVLVLIPSHRVEKIYVEKEANISRPLIADFGGCNNGNCILIIYNNGTKRIKCNQIKLYRDGKFYSNIADFKDIYGQPCDYIDPKKYIKLKTPNLCQGVEKITIKSNFTSSIIQDERLYSMYVSNYLCLEKEYNKTKI